MYRDEFDVESVWLDMSKVQLVKRSQRKPKKQKN